MLERAAVARDRPSAADPSGGRRWPLAFLACAGVMGASGVALGAAAAHRGGGGTVATASDFLLLHAAAVVGASSVAMILARVSAVFVAALALLVVGSLLFSGELALAGLWDLRPIPIAAPAGGLCLMAGWLLLAAASVIGLGRRR